ncbi:MAG: hypothetical protein U1D26_00085 [Patescibacteria group bacterium]|nr:hypothetical protein [Patescibacteria group bacterium]
MESTNPGTFIPRDTVAPVSRARRSGLDDLLLVGAIVLVVASAALAVGVLLYGQLLQTQQNSKLAELKRAEEAFQPSLIQQLTRLDDRMHAADAILRVHIAPTVFFSALGASTLQTVSFQSLNYEETDSQNVTVKMQGLAQSVNSIALQDDLFSRNGVITNPIFSNISRQPNGVRFEVTAHVNPTAVNFATLVSGAVSNDAVVPEVQPQVPAGTLNSPFGDPSAQDAAPPDGSAQQQ